MKKVILTILSLSPVFFQQNFAQDSAQQRQLTSLLSQYYGIKDALVKDDSKLASIKAAEFIKTTNSIDYKLISEGNINALLKDATAISEAKNINTQRDRFAKLSDNMAALAKSIRLGTDPVYLQYCPMKKANWLSYEKEVKNPYYGNAMLSCGSVISEIAQPN